MIQFSNQKEAAAPVDFFSTFAAAPKIY